MPKSVMKVTRLGSRPGDTFVFMTPTFMVTAHLKINSSTHNKVKKYVLPVKAFFNLLAIFILCVNKKKYY